jgi:hypothetical protein
MEVEEKIKKLQDYKSKLFQWERTSGSPLGLLRLSINQDTRWVQQEIIEARCFQTLTIGPPPAVGGLLARDVDSF